MDSSMGAGFMAVFAVSGSVVFLSLQVHKRLLSNFMKKIEFELGYEKDQSKKRVRFSPEVVPSENKGCYRKKHVSSSNPRFNAAVAAAAVPSLQVAGNRQLDASMPLNWQVLYKGKLESRKLSTNCI